MPEVGVREWSPSFAVSFKTCCLKPQRATLLKQWSLCGAWNILETGGAGGGVQRTPKAGACATPLGLNARAGGPGRDWLGSQGAGSVAEGLVAPCPPKSSGVCGSSSACAAALRPQECASSTQWAACISKVTGAAGSPGWPCTCPHRHMGPMRKQGGCRWHPPPKTLP